MYMYILNLYNNLKKLKYCLFDHHILFIMIIVKKVATLRVYFFNKNMSSTISFNMNTNTNTNPINMNHQIRGDEWKELEKSPGKGTEMITTCLAKFVSCLTDRKAQSDMVQTSYPTTFPKGWDELRKNSKIIKHYKIEPDLEMIYTSSMSKKMNKTDKLKLANTMGKYNKDLMALSTKATHIPGPIGSSLVEFKVLELILFMNCLMESFNEKNSDKMYILPKAYEAFFGIGKILENIHTFDVKHHTTHDIIKIPEIIVQPLITKYNQFTSLFNFNFSVASSQYPKFFYSTEFDKIFPGMSVKPYESQRQILEFVNDNINNQFFCVMNTLMGMGKTWVAGYIGLLVYLNNKKYGHLRGYSKKTFIYTCPETLKSVRHVVGRILHHHTVSFALAYIEKNKLVVKKQNACKGDNEKPTVILAGVQATIELLKKDYINKREEYIIDKENNIVFFDEPTMMMDMENSPMIPYIAEFYRYLPSQTIMSSATLPDIENLQSLKTFASSKYPEIQFRTIDYSKVVIGTQLNYLDGEMFIPHAGCVDANAMKEFIERIESNLMYKKFYTIPLVRAMYEKIVELGLVLPFELNFDNWMSQLSHRNQESVQNLAVEYLKFIIFQSVNTPDIIQRFNSVRRTNKPINFDDLVGTSRVLSGQTFISNPNPELLAEAKFSAYFADVLAKIGVRNFEDLYDRYKKQMVLQEKKIQSAAKAKSSRGDEKISQIERLRAACSDPLTSVEIGIPSHNMLRDGTSSITLGSVNWDKIIASDFLKLASLFGVFVYSEESHHTYHVLVSDIISRGTAIYVFADSTLNYGNSFPFNNGIITNEMGTHSDKTLLQLMARAGRPGVSHTALIYAGDEILTSITNAIYNKNYINLEISNLELTVEMAMNVSAQKGPEQLGEIRQSDELTRIMCVYDTNEVNVNQQIN